MSCAKLVMAACLAAISTSACSTAVKPAVPASGTLISRGRIDDPRTTKNDHLACIESAHLPVKEVGASGLQIGSAPVGPTVVFAPTPGAAQADQIQGEAQGAEVIGSALLYPHQAPDRELAQIEDCLAKGVSG